jgi:hypothetical protein
MTCTQIDGGKTVGSSGSEDGVIVRDEEHIDGARITLERGSRIAPFAITCGVYGWMFHTRFFGDEAAAQAQFDLMRAELTRIIAIIPLKTGPDARAKSSLVCDAISAFVDHFP